MTVSSLKELDKNILSLLQKCCSKPIMNILVHWLVMVSVGYPQVFLRKNLFMRHQFQFLQLVKAGV